MDETKQLPPVFVDVTGRRRRRVRRVAYVFGTASLVYTGLVGAGFSGGPIDPHALLPLPDLLDRPEAVPSTPATARPQPRPQSSAPAPTDTSVVMNEAIPAPTTPPPPAAALAVLAGFGPAAGRPLEHLEATPTPTSMSPALATEPTRPADDASASEPVEPVEPLAATPDPQPEPSAAATPTAAAATTEGSAGSATSGTPQQSQPVAREGRRPSPRPLASGASR